MSKDIKFKLHFEYDKTLRDIRKNIRARTI